MLTAILLAALAQSPPQDMLAAMVVPRQVVRVKAVAKAVAVPPAAPIAVPPPVRWIWTPPPIVVSGPPVSAPAYYAAPFTCGPNGCGVAPARGGFRVFSGGFR
jgi:hypothetical protein